jgi:hypothetical protein
MSRIRVDWFLVKLAALTAAVLTICSLDVSAWTMAASVVGLLAATFLIERRIRAVAGRNSVALPAAVVRR